jgi:hypothetical protein
VVRGDFHDPGGTDRPFFPFEIREGIKAGLLVELRFADVSNAPAIDQGNVIMMHHATGQKHDAQQQYENIFHSTKVTPEQRITHPFDRYYGASSELQALKKGPQINTDEHRFFEKILGLLQKGGC